MEIQKSAVGPESEGAQGDESDAAAMELPGGQIQPSGVTWPHGQVPWQRVSPKYAWADLAINLFIDLIVVVIGVVILVVRNESPAPIFFVIFGAVIVLLLINSLLAFRRVRAIGYILREDDLLFRRGIMFERYIAVPYGRLQLVDVNRGPLLRGLGLATLKFVTASAATGVQLPGLPLEEAEALRDRLVALAETRRSGL